MAASNGGDGKRPRVDSMNPAARAMRKGRTRVQNKSAAGVQMTAEQLFAESYDLYRREADGQPDLIIQSRAELAQVQAAKREDFEGLLRKDQGLLASWLKYARWEADIARSEARARSVYERAADYHAGNKEYWKDYALFEMGHGNVSKTRNVLERAVATIPGDEDVWLLAATVEQAVGTPQTSRDLFNRWLRYDPAAGAWRSFVRFELSLTDAPDRAERVRAVLSRYVAKFNDERAWLFYAKCEVDLQDKARAIEVLETGLQALPDAFARCPKLVCALTRLYEDTDAIDKARDLYTHAISAAGRDGTVLTEAHDRLKKEYEDFEMIYGDPEQLERAVLDSRRVYYHDLLAKEPDDVMGWLSLVAVEEQRGVPPQEIAAIYDRAAHAWRPEPRHAHLKDAWRPLAFLWEARALHRELRCGDIAGAEAAWKEALATVADRPFTFSKLWLGLVELHIRQQSLPTARAIFDAAISHRATPKLFNRGIEIERELGATDRCRELFAAFTQAFASRPDSWIAFADFEATTSGIDVADEVFRKALQTEELADRDAVWVAAIQARLKRGEVDGARGWYVQLLSTTRDVTVRLAKNSTSDVAAKEALEGMLAKLRRVHALYGTFELNFGGDAAVDKLREQWRTTVKQVRAANVAASTGLVAEWRTFEGRHGTLESQRAVDGLIDKPIRKRRDVFAAAAAFGGQ